MQAGSTASLKTNTVQTILHAPVFSLGRSGLHFGGLGLGGLGGVLVGVDAVGALLLLFEDELLLCEIVLGELLPSEDLGACSSGRARSTTALGRGSGGGGTRASALSRTNGALV